jgi:hypothetical protein
MIRAFILDTSSGPNNPVNSGWLFIAFVVANEIRGIWAAWEGAKAMGWL